MSRRNKTRGNLVEAMRKFPERFIPDKRQQSLQKEADEIARMAIGEVPEPIGKVSSAEMVDGNLVVHGTIDKEHALRMGLQSCGLFVGDKIISTEEAVLQQIADMSDAEIRTEMHAATGAMLTDEEIAALKLKRSAPEDRCPNCGTGSAGGLGFNQTTDRCMACGFVGKRTTQPSIAS